MPMKKSNLILLIYLLSFFNLCAQQGSSFDHIVMTKTGKINNDKILDSAVVKQDTISEFRPYRLEIYFGRDDGENQLVLRTDKAIQPDFPNGKNTILTGGGFWEIEIKDHGFWIKHELLRGYFEHKFQYRDNKFKLLEYTYVESDGRGKTYYENLDFITGIRRTKIESYQEDKVLEQHEEFINIEPKPDLTDFQPRSNKFY